MQLRIWLIVALVLPTAYAPGCSGSDAPADRMGMPDRALPATATYRHAGERSYAARAARANPYAGASGASAAATSQYPIDLPTVLRLASGQNLDVVFVRQKVREAHAEMQQAGQWIVPVIRPSTRFQRVDGNVQGTQGGVFDVSKNNAFLGGAVYADWELSETIFNQLSAFRRHRAACHASDAAMNDAILAAAEAYFELLRGQSALAIADQSLATYERLTKETQAQVDAGGGFRGEVLRARAQVNHAKVLQRKADEERLVAAARLRELLNLPSHVELYASEAAPAKIEMIDPNAPEEQLIGEAMRGRPELAEARMLAQAAKADKDKTTYGPWLPTVRAGWEGGGFGHNYGSLGGSSNVGVGLEWKVGPGGIGDKARTNAAVARERQQWVRFNKARQMVVRDVASAKAEATTRSEAMQAAEVGVSEAQEALELFQQRTQIGVGQPLDAIVAQEILITAQTDYLDAVIGYNKAQMRLLRALGRRP